MAGNRRRSKQKKITLHHFNKQKELNDDKVIHESAFEEDFDFDVEYSISRAAINVNGERVMTHKVNMPEYNNLLEQCLNNQPLTERVTDMISATLTSAGVNLSADSTLVSDVYNKLISTFKTAGTGISMYNLAIKSFRDSFDALRNAGLSAKDHIVAAQGIADMMLDVYSPIAFANYELGESELDEYSDSFVAGNPDMLKQHLENEKLSENEIFSTIYKVSKDLENAPDLNKQDVKIKYAPFYKEYKKRYDNEEFMDGLKEELYEILRESGTDLTNDDIKENVDGAISRVIEEIDGTIDSNFNPENLRYLEPKANGYTPIDIMPIVVDGIFKKIIDEFYDYETYTLRNDLVTCQKISNLLLGRLTPIAFENGALDKYINDYYLVDNDRKKEMFKDYYDDEGMEEFMQRDTFAELGKEIWLVDQYRQQQNAEANPELDDDVEELGEEQLDVNAEEQKLAEEEAKRKAEEEEAQRKAEEEAKKRAEEEEAQRKAEEEAKRKAEEEEAQRKADEEAKRRAEEEEAQRKADEEAKRRAEEEEAERKAEEEAQGSDDDSDMDDDESEIGDDEKSVVGDDEQSVIGDDEQSVINESVINDDAKSEVNDNESEAYSEEEIDPEVDPIGYFTKKYDISGLDLNQTYDGMRRLNGLNDFVLSSSPEKKMQSIYLDTLTAAMRTYLNNNFKMESAKEYSAQDISIGGFVEDFDKVFREIASDAAKKNGQTYEHTAYAGLSSALMATRVWKNVEYFNKTLPELWAYQIRKGTITYESLQHVTNTAAAALDHVHHADDMGEVEDRHLVDIVMARNAMQTAINNRSFFSYLNPRNWGPYRRETNYLNELNAKISTLEAMNINVTDIIPEDYEEKILETPLDDLKVYVQNPENRTTAKSLEAQNVQNQQHEVKEPAIVPENATNTLKQYTDNYEYINEFSKRLLEMLPEGKNVQSERDFNGAIGFNAKFMMGNYNAKYDSSQAIGNTDGIRYAFHQQLQFIFSDSLTIAQEKLGYVNETDQYVAAQIITDMFMKEFSPVRLHPEKYGKYASGYVLDNIDKLTKFWGTDKDLVNRAKAKYNRLTSKDGASMEADEQEAKLEGDIISNDAKKEADNPIAGNANDKETLDKLKAEFTQFGVGAAYFPAEPKKEEISIKEEADKIYDNTAKREQFVRDVANALPKNSVSTDAKVEMINKKMYDFYNVNIKENNDSYDVFKDTDKYHPSLADDTITDILVGVFQVSTWVADSMGYKSEKEKLVAAQLMTDMFVKEYSPIRFVPKLKEFGESYILKNPDEFSTLFDKTNKKDIADASKEYSKIMESRQKISVNDANEKSDNNVSSKVDEKKSAVKESVKD